VVPQAVTDFIRAQGWGRVTHREPVTGGSISHGQALQTSDGPALFLKVNPTAPADMFTREAEGLAALGAVPHAPRVPKVYLGRESFLLSEYLSPAAPAANYWDELGRQLAHLHAATSGQFGFSHDNYVGATPQPNPWTNDGHEFFADHRLRFQATLAQQSGRLTGAHLRQLERLIVRLPDLIPTQPASLIHGDLWSGNIISGPDGQACLIDPAAHYGWAEADLAMTTLFGQPPQHFFAAYQTVRDLPPGYQNRLDLYNLYHMLNHLNIFGDSYRTGIESILARYS